MDNIKEFCVIMEGIMLDLRFLRGLDEEKVIKQSKPGFIIAISREHGTAGKQIGLAVAEKLNLPF